MFLSLSDENYSNNKSFLYMSNTNYSLFDYGVCNSTKYGLFEFMVSSSQLIDYTQSEFYFIKTNSIKYDLIQCHLFEQECNCIPMRMDEFYKNFLKG